MAPDSSATYNYFYYLNQYWYDVRDPRTRDLWLINLSPWTMASIMATYLLLVTKILPKIMEKREPFQLRKTMLVYNVAMVVSNFFFFCICVYECEYGSRFWDFEYPTSADDSPETMYEIRMGHLYWLTKFADLFDTFMFVLRKKQSHITFLHLYHHTVVPSFGYIFFRINPMIPAVGVFALINTFIHVAMYSYYALSALGPRVRHLLWWKKYITSLQLGQFFILAVFGCIVYFKQTGYPPFWLYLGLSQPPFFFYMFYDFYQKTYNSRERCHNVNDNYKDINNNKYIANGKANGIKNGIKHD